MLEGLRDGLQNTKDFLTNETIQRVEQLSDALAETLQREVVASFQNWLEAHPLVSWSIAHPLWTSALFLGLLLLLGGLLRVVTRLSEQVWLVIFQVPLKLGQWLLGIVFSAFTKVLASQGANRESRKEDRQERLAYILLRLEAIRQEQEALLEEMKAIVVLES